MHKLPVNVGSLCPDWSQFLDGGTTDSLNQRASVYTNFSQEGIYMFDDTD